MMMMMMMMMSDCAARFVFLNLVSSSISLFPWFYAATPCDVAIFCLAVSVLLLTISRPAALQHWCAAATTLQFGGMT